MPSPELDTSRKAVALNRIIANFQESFTVIEKCPKPVIAAIHGACIGAGVDLICACDMRYCTQDAWFQIKEVDIGIVADVGTLQRLPKIVGNDSLVRELCFTARVLKAKESQEFGLVSKMFADKEAMLIGTLEVAALIASKSPIAVQGTKESLIYARDHSVDEALRQVRTMNQSMLQSEDVMKAITAAMTKEQPVYAKL
jgi:delta(3,5)-delta(2,4)-dienoyl-CoA isomerase